MKTNELALRMQQRQTAINRATTYFRSGGADSERLTAVLMESCPELNPEDLRQIVARCRIVEQGKPDANEA